MLNGRVSLHVLLKVFHRRGEIGRHVREYPFPTPELWRFGALHGSQFRNSPAVSGNVKASPAAHLVEDFGEARFRFNNSNLQVFH
jgi:hypothetical protein